MDHRVRHSSCAEQQQQQQQRRKINFITHSAMSQRRCHSRIQLHSQADPCLGVVDLFRQPAVTGRHQQCFVDALHAYAPTSKSTENQPSACQLPPADSCAPAVNYPADILCFILLLVLAAECKYAHNAFEAWLHPER
jgi:hypothetical protein